MGLSFGKGKRKDRKISQKSDRRSDTQTETTGLTQTTYFFDSDMSDTNVKQLTENSQHKSPEQTTDETMNSLNDNQYQRPQEFTIDSSSVTNDNTSRDYKTKTTITFKPESEDFLDIDLM